MEDIVIAPADAGHIDSIPRIELAAATRFSATDLPLDVRYRVTEPESVRHALERETLWVATTEDDEAVGFAMADVMDDQAWLDEIDVLPVYWGRGIGTELVRTVLHWARSQGAASAGAAPVWRAAGCDAAKRCRVAAAARSIPATP